ncbi:MAG: ergothioneine biosynthesis protein EgtB [Planctomycetes bacterium]|nr:ergothioneine biosynthesis protein EgtB [Planctomycetota bacterium]
MPDRAEILARYRTVRAHTREICAPLQTEDYVVQPMTDVSPPRWHIAHVTWFFEQFLLGEFAKGYQPVHPQYAFLFNSYYNLIGERTERPRRGVLTRPTVAEIWAYREEVDKRMAALIEGCDDATLQALMPILEVGLNHEQQHQELLVTDIKFILFQAPLYPAYISGQQPVKRKPESGWTQLDAGVLEFGHDGKGFAFDNEGPRHKRLVPSCRLANGLVTNAQYMEFMHAGGYTRPELWLSDGWDVAQQQGWKAPQYWLQQDGEWQAFTLHGLAGLQPDAPVCHVSYYEADAFARWAGKRLATEFEWEAVSGKLPGIGQAWEWTSSAYLPYPGYCAPEGAIGEYNGKFMVNQMVLRGGSAATPAGHIRPTYRNFWHPDKRWQFTGIRLAEDA